LGNRRYFHRLGTRIEIGENQEKRDDLEIPFPQFPFPPSHCLFLQSKSTQNMAKKYQEYKTLNLPEVAKDIQKKWSDNNVFEKSISTREGKPSFVFYEGPPSANGMPGIHHAMGRTIKDIFCRYKTLQGFQVKRKAGWDTHGLPVELGVEKELGITKEDIGNKISVEEYNKSCRETVMRYTDKWNQLTQDMGYWVDMENPYVTYESKYMESVWWLLKQLFEKNLIYKGYTVQPYSPKAGTGLSSHEINQPGCYRDVKDTTVVAQFKAKAFDKSPFKTQGEIFFMAWTTTPWTLPSNTALTVGPKIEYSLVKTYNQYTFEQITVVLATPLIGKQFGKPFYAVETDEELASYEKGAKKIPFMHVETCVGKDLVGWQYEQLMDYVQPHENPEKAFVIISGDFVTTEDGTGIVHTAPTFGADDAKVAAEAGVPGLLVENELGHLVPLVDLQGKFRAEMGPYAGKYVKNEYYNDDEIPERSIDVEIAIHLKEANRAFKVEKYTHSYPHCWRTDKPILYYPLDSWFIKSTAAKERMMELNKTINWKPASTGTGRFGKWLENLNDWNLSRSRYWGIPIPIWSTKDGSERKCIGSVEELKVACDESVKAGVMAENPLAHFNVGDMSKENYDAIDLHKNYVDEIVLVSSTGERMEREADLIDVWFDSGSMPYAQWHYPFENKELVDQEGAYPADFIAEGVDQTRGWFYTLHAISTMVFDKVAYKNVVSNGLVLDKNGQKMSKRLGNGVDPFTTLAKYGPDATRWYMITNAQPWDNLKFDVDGIQEVQRKFFGTLHNTYSFFALYANLDRFDPKAKEIPFAERPEIDRWILSKLNSLIKEVESGFEAYEPTRVGRAIQEFVIDQLSNWFVRLSRRRFWKQEENSGNDKISAYQTIYKCLETVAVLGAPIAPFFMDRLYADLSDENASVHLADYPKVEESHIDVKLEAQMEIAQKVSSLVLGLRKKEKIRVRQPLQKIMIPALNKEFTDNIHHIEDLILSEINVKELEILAEDNDILVKGIKPNFKTIGPKYGKRMKSISKLVATFEQLDIQGIENSGQWIGEIDGQEVVLEKEDFEISAQEIPGWLVATEGSYTVALDISINEQLRSEGIARELVNRVQNLRKDSGLEITDRILLKLDCSEVVKTAIQNNERFVCNEVLANGIEFMSLAANATVTDIESAEDTKMMLEKA
jgi:isoleucyl-tRNA synthetase